MLQNLFWRKIRVNNLSQIIHFIHFLVCISLVVFPFSSFYFSSREGDDTSLCCEMHHHNDLCCDIEPHRCLRGPSGSAGRRQMSTCLWPLTLCGTPEFYVRTRLVRMRRRSQNSVKTVSHNILFLVGAGADCMPPRVAISYQWLAIGRRGNSCTTKTSACRPPEAPSRRAHPSAWGNGEASRFSALTGHFNFRNCG